MYLSADRKLLFVHIQKTGGSSLTQVLKQHVPDLEEIGGTHDHAGWMRETLADKWPHLFKFAFVRNPWDRLVSWYSMIQDHASDNNGLKCLQYILSCSSPFY